MEKDLRSHGTEVQGGGYTMSPRQLAEYFKERKGKKYDSPIVRTIADQLHALNPQFMDEFGIKQLIEMDPNTLRLHSRTRRGVVNIDIHYDEGPDTYSITAYKIEGTDAKQIFKNSDIYVDKFDTVLDAILRPTIAERAQEAENRGQEKEASRLERQASKESEEARIRRKNVRGETKTVEEFMKGYRNDPAVRKHDPAWIPGPEDERIREKARLQYQARGGAEGARKRATKKILRDIRKGGRRYDLAEREDGLIDPDKAPEPIDIYGYDGTVVRIVPDVNHLLEFVITLPHHVWDEVFRILEDNGYLDEDQVDERGNPGVEVDLDNRRLVRRGRVTTALNVFLDSE